jgi:hypothetical protein
MKILGCLPVLAVSLLLAVCFTGNLAAKENQTRWSITDDNAIVWTVKPGEAHEDNIEMSGKKVSVIVTYGVDTNQELSLSEFVVFPTFRTVPQNTRSHISQHFGAEAMPVVLVNGVAPENDKVESFRHKGIMQISGSINGHAIAWTRTIFPSTDKPAIIEIISLTNNSSAPVTVEVKDPAVVVHTPAARGLEGSYAMSAHVEDAGGRTLQPGEGTTFTEIFSARHDADQDLTADAVAELQARAALVQSYLDNLQLETPDKVLNTAFAFAKIRTTESIFQTKAGLMHSPGGGRYYAAIWANDQGEYAGPFFPFIGDPAANEATTNAYRLFADYMNAAYKPIPSSIVAEGVTNWHGAGDRGDMAMLAYGASRYALACGNEQTATNVWPLVEWCLEYLHRKVDTNGVVESDADELENRFPSGKANLCTSCLYYDALHSAVYLGKALGKPQSQLDGYTAEATALRAAIENYFGRNVDGFATYRYFDKSVPSVNRRALVRFAHYANEPDYLRAWICIPLTVGIFDRAPGTIDALFSPKLWTPDGLATQAGDTVFWDRSTLFALRGVFAAGDTEKALDYLDYYSARRLLGEHVPYPVEAYPEGNQSHLAAESALYCLIYTGGMFGIRPTGLHSFDCTPRLPKEWPEMSLRHIRAFDRDFDLRVSRQGDKLSVEIFENGSFVKSSKIDDGGTVAIDL